jgi:hypothetical protein
MRKGENDKQNKNGYSNQQKPNSKFGVPRNRNKRVTFGRPRLMTPQNEGMEVEEEETTTIETETVINDAPKTKKITATTISHVLPMTADVVIAIEVAMQVEIDMKTEEIMVVVEVEGEDI